MMKEYSSGFAEVEHTADWALKVWAPDLSRLFATAAQGMYWLMETTLRTEPRAERSFEMEGEDPEGLLVAFLSELLYYGESEGLGFDSFQVLIEPKSTGRQHLSALVSGTPLLEIKKEIKAVTYHNLEIQKTELGVTVTIVFDV